jgi:hypothetical protein
MGYVTRTERLLALVAELRAATPQPSAVRDLAARLGTTERTVRRDLATLVDGGLHVLSYRGCVVLVPDPRPAVPEGAASLARPVRDTVAAAVIAKRVLRISYTDQSGDRSVRDVEAHGLVTAPYGEYLVGWCRLRDDVRMFRLDRIGAALVTGGDAGVRDLDDLLAALRVPEPRRPADTGRPTDPARARAWALARLTQVRARLADTAAEARAAGEGVAGLRAVYGHLAEWTRWQVAAVRAVATGADLCFDGRRPDFPPEFDRDLPYAARERLIQDAMAVRSFAELARDLDEVLDGAAHWAADCADLLWRQSLPEPGRPGSHRPLADLLAGWQSPVSHVEWHLDRLTDPLDPAFDFDWGEPDHDLADPPLVEQCPLRR